MALNLDLVIDSRDGLLGDVSGGELIPVLSRNDSVNLRVRLMERRADGTYAESAANPVTIQAALGRINSSPVRGAFKVSTATGTSQEIAYNAATTAVRNAVSGVAGNVTVEAWGSGGSAWLISAATANSALSFSGVSVSLFPTSQIRISTLQAPASGVTAVQLVELVRAPAVSCSSFVAAATANVVTLSLVQTGSTSPAKNTSYLLSIGPEAIGGQFSLSYQATTASNNSSTGIPVACTTAQIRDALGLLTGANNLSVAETDGGFTLSLVGDLGNRNVTTAITLDAGAVRYATIRTGVLTLSGLDLEQIFLDSASSVATASLEIQVTADGSPATLIQRQVLVQRDLVLP